MHYKNMLQIKIYWLNFQKFKLCFAPFRVSYTTILSRYIYFLYPSYVTRS